jgi:seipin
MIDLALLAPSASSSPATYLKSPVSTANASNSILALSRRPAILTYASPIIDTAHKLSGLPWYMLGWRKESEVLEIGMYEGVEFAKGWRNVPDRVQVIVEAGETMQFYEVGVKIVARFSGLRYVSPHTSLLRKAVFFHGGVY